MERLFKRESIQVACGVTYNKKARFKQMAAVRVEGLTQDLSIEGVRLRLYEQPSLRTGQLVRFDVGAEHDAHAIIRGIDPAGANVILRLEFVEASQGFLAQIVPIIKSPGVRNSDVSEWSAV